MGSTKGSTGTRLDTNASTQTDTNFLDLSVLNLKSRDRQERYLQRAKGHVEVLRPLYAQIRKRLQECRRDGNTPLDLANDLTREARISPEMGLLAYDLLELVEGIGLGFAKEDEARQESFRFFLDNIDKLRPLVGEEVLF